MQILHPIQYNFVLGERPSRNNPAFIVPEELKNDFLFSLGLYPHTFEHLVMGSDYYQAILNTGERSGYLVTFIYADTINLAKVFSVRQMNDAVNVYFICTKNPRCLDEIADALKKEHNERCLYLVDAFQKAWFAWDNVFSSSYEAIDYLKTLAPKYVDFLKVEKPYYVPKCIKDIDNGLTFNPTVINTLTSHSMLGDWNYKMTEYSDEDKARDSRKACNHSDSFDRQDKMIGQIFKMMAVENQALYPIHKTHPTLDQINAPLIITIPFTHKDMRDYLKDIHVPGYDNVEKSLRYVLSQPTNKNYTIDFHIEEGDAVLSLERVTAAYSFVFFPRGRFLDIVGQLHASYKFSPYLRLPFQGVEINRELSFVAPSISERLCNAKDKESLEKIMKQVGAKIVEGSLSQDAQKMLKECTKQIVAITDLPIEWLPLDGIPLGFTHDICRIAEFPLEGNLMHYVVNEVQKYRIPKDILKHTLVVYGTRDEAFVYYQNECDDLAKKHGFTTQYCVNKQQFFDVVKEVDPQLLVIDTHGNYDEKSHQSYLLMGDERIYPQDIIEHHIQVPLVFLSACNTAPTYNMVNTLANGFVQSGSLAVTSSYLPLDVSESSTVYLRLLEQLSLASNQSIHKNWLAFISHILRSSYIHQAFYNYYKNTKKSIVDVAVNGLSTQYLTRSMIFDCRRKVYEELHEGFDVEGIHVETSHKIPHYLMYTTLGRADLIDFESYHENLKERLETMMQNENADGRSTQNEE